LTSSTLPSKPRADIAEAVTMHHALGIPVEAIAARFGVAASTVDRWIREATPFVLRRCRCGTEMALRRTDSRTDCARCRGNAAARDREARWRAAPTCRECREPMLEPNASHLCGLCSLSEPVAA
jgi:transposase-like protein